MPDDQTDPAEELDLLRAEVASLRTELAELQRTLEYARGAETAWRALLEQERSTRAGTGRFIHRGGSA